jgi:glyoxylase-like metal-dependent hydrolase (beta-lactamase superfamily II)
MLTTKVFSFSPIQENTYIVYNEQQDCCIIDPGCYFPAEEDTLKQFITDQHLRPKYLLNTHCHLDHVFGNRFVHETWQLPLYLHPKEVLVLEYAPKSGERWNLPFRNYEGPFNFLQEGDIIAIGNDKLEVLFAPGHSPGHICFYCREQQFVIGGDVLFKMSIGRTDLPGGDHELLLKKYTGKTARITR